MVSDEAGYRSYLVQPRAIQRVQSGPGGRRPQAGGGRGHVGHMVQAHELLESDGYDDDEEEKEEEDGRYDEGEEELYDEEEEEEEEVVSGQLHGGRGMGGSAWRKGAVAATPGRQLANGGGGSGGPSAAAAVGGAQLLPDDVQELGRLGAGMARLGLLLPGAGAPRHGGLFTPAALPPGAANPGLRPGSGAGSLACSPAKAQPHLAQALEALLHA